MRAPFAYYGGKKKIAKWLAELCPPHCIYAEPFAGGAGLFWAKGRPKVSNADSYREVLNDTNGAIVSVYRALRDHPDEVRRLVALTPYSEREYRTAAEVYRGGHPGMPDANRAAYLLLFWASSFAGKAGGGLKRGRTSENPAMTWSNKARFVDGWASRLQGVYIEDLDYAACMARWDTPGTLHYCDPPYVGANQGHYSGWTDDDRRALFVRAAGMEGSVMISGYLDAWCLTFAEDRRWGVYRRSVGVSAGHEKARRVEWVVVKPSAPIVGTQATYLRQQGDLPPATLASLP